MQYFLLMLTLQSKILSAYSESPSPTQVLLWKSQLTQNSSYGKKHWQRTHGVNKSWSLWVNVYFSESKINYRFYWQTYLLSHLLFFTLQGETFFSNSVRNFVIFSKKTNKVTLNLQSTLKIIKLSLNNRLNLTANSTNHLAPWKHLLEN